MVATTMEFFGVVMVVWCCGEVVVKLRIGLNEFKRKIDSEERREEILGE